LSIITSENGGSKTLIKKSGQKVWENTFFRTKKEEKRQSQKRIHAFFD